MSDNGKTGPHAPFDQEIDTRVIYRVGGILAGTTLAVYLIVWGLLHLYEGRDKARGKTANPLLKADNARRLQQRVESIQGPPLEGLQPEDNKLLLEMVHGQEWFYIPPSAFIKSDGEKVQDVYELREGTEVKVAYWERDNRHVVTTIVTPIPKKPETFSEEKIYYAWGKILKIEPLTIRGWREWAAARKDRYGWTDRDKKIVHVPLEQAMQSVLQTEEFKKAGKAHEPAPWLDRATSSSSGRGAKEQRR
jgi:hypothetical protein